MGDNGKENGNYYNRMAPASFISRRIFEAQTLDWYVPLKFISV